MRLSINGVKKKNFICMRKSINFVLYFTFSRIRFKIDIRNILNYKNMVKEPIYKDNIKSTN